MNSSGEGAHLDMAVRYDAALPTDGGQNRVPLAPHERERDLHGISLDTPAVKTLHRSLVLRHLVHKHELLGTHSLQTVASAQGAVRGRAWSAMRFVKFHRRSSRRSRAAVVNCQESTAVAQNKMASSSGELTRFRVMRCLPRYRQIELASIVLLVCNDTRMASSSR